MLHAGCTCRVCGTRYTTARLEGCPKCAALRCDECGGRVTWVDKVGHVCYRCDHVADVEET